MKQQIQSQQFTIESLITNESCFPILQEYMNLYCSLLRTLYNILFNNQNMTRVELKSLKREFVSKYGVKSRNFGSLFIEAKGMLDSQKELVKENQSTIKSKITKTKNQLKGKSLSKNRIIHLKTTLNQLKQKLANTM